MCRGTKTTRNKIAMQDRKYRSCELGIKETEKNNQNSNTLMRQKIFYWKVASQMVLEITTRSHQKVLTAAAHKNSLRSVTFLAYHVSSQQLLLMEIPQPKELHAALLSNLTGDFKDILYYNFSIKCFVFQLNICSFFLLLCTIALNCGFFDPAVIFDLKSFLCLLHSCNLSIWM